MGDAPVGAVGEFEQPDDDFQAFIRAGGIPPRRDGHLRDAVASGDRLESLIAVRDYLAWELEGHRCKTCSMSQLRTGDTAALVLRLCKVMEEIDELQAERAKTKQTSGLASLREGRGTVTDIKLGRKRRSDRDGTAV